MMNYVLDASALMAFFEDRAGGEKVEGLLSKAAEAKRPLLMSVVNWGEVYYAIWRAHGEKAANTKLQETAQLPIELTDVGRNLPAWPPASKLSTVFPTSIASPPPLPKRGKPSWSRVTKTLSVLRVFSESSGSEALSRPRQR